MTLKQQELQLILEHARMKEKLISQTNINNMESKTPPKSITNDSLGKNIGQAGKFIARIIEERE
jgi:hypothetical protein